MVRRLGANPLSGAVDDEALTASVEGLHRAETMIAAEKLRRIGEVDARKAYLGKAMSTADWAASRLGLTPLGGQDPDRDRGGAGRAARDRATVRRR